MLFTVRGKRLSSILIKFIISALQKWQQLFYNLFIQNLKLFLKFNTKHHFPSLIQKKSLSLSQFDSLSLQKPFREFFKTEPE